MPSFDTDSPAVIGRYSRAVRAPKGLRKVFKLGEIDRLIEQCDAHRETYSRLERAEFAMVARMRGRGASWDSIGWVFGVTGDAVRQRFGDRITVDALVDESRAK